MGKKKPKRILCMRQKCGLAPFFFQIKAVPEQTKKQKAKQKIVLDSKGGGLRLAFFMLCLWQPLGMSGMPQKSRN
ncbi:MAG: hypothetical protein M0Z50_09810 [Planctomycetia bacterium]|nr:hypothetical protein [Planctomycetia bacterium]